MTTLRLAIDAREMRRGADEAQRATRDVQSGAREAARSVEQLQTRVSAGGEAFRGFGSAAAGVSGVLGAGSSFTQFGREIQNINSGLNASTNAAFAFSRGLLEVARVREDFGALARETSRTSGVFGTLVGLVRANPLLILATGLGVAATAMSLFGRDTQETTQQIDRQTEALKSLERAQQELADRRAIEQVRQRVGIAQDPENVRVTQRDFLVQQSARLGTSGLPIEANRLAEFLETTIDDLRRRLQGQSFGTDAFGRPAQSFGFLTDAGDALVDPGNFLRSGALPSTPQGFSNAAARFLLEQQARQLNQPGTAERPPQIGPQPLPIDRSGLDEYLNALRQETQLLGVSIEERDRLVATYNAEAIARQGNIDLSDQERSDIRQQIDLQRQLIELRQLGEDVGAALGEGLFRAATGADSLRGALAGVLRQLAQIAQSRFVQQFSNFLGNGFGQTAAQSQSSGVEFGPQPPPGYQG